MDTEQEITSAKSDHNSHLLLRKDDSSSLHPQNLGVMRDVFDKCMLGI